MTAGSGDDVAISSKVTYAEAFTAKLAGNAAAAVAYNSTTLDMVKTQMATITSAATLATATTGLDTFVSSVTTGGAAAGGTTYTLTTALDSLTGTSGADTFKGDFTATATLNAGDSIDGGSGSDTLQMFGTYAAGNMPLNIKNVENLKLAVAAAADLNLSAFTKASTGIEKVIISDATLLSANTITTTAGQSLSLATGAGSAVTAGLVTWAAGATDATLNLELAGYQAVAGGVPAGVTVTGAAASTLNIASVTGANKIATLTGPTTVTKHVITGDKALTYAAAAADVAALNSIDGSANTGGTNVDVSAAATKVGFTFTGGTGNDSIKLKDDQLASLTAGTQLNGGTGTDKIGLLDTALTAAEAAKLNAAVGFETVGLNAGITLDASLVTLKSYSIDTTALTQTINNLATGSTITVNAAAPTSLTLAGATGVSDMTVNLGTASSTGNITVGTLVTTGMTAVALTSNGTGTHTNAITTLTNSDNSSFTVSGSQQLTLALSAGTAIGSKVDATAMTGKLIVTGSSGTGFGDILIGGTAADTINGLKGADKMTGGAGADTFTFTADAGANANGVAFGSFDEITDFVAGTDKLQFNTADVVSAQQTAVQTAVSALAATASATDIATAMAAANTTNLGVSFAVFGGNTYVLYETTGAGAGVVADDIFIKLTGVTTAPTYAVDVAA